MDCLSFADITEEYLLGSLPKPEQRAAEEHLRSCASCRVAAEEYQATILGLGLAVPQISPPPELKRVILETARQERTHRAGSDKPPEPAAVAPIRAAEAWSVHWGWPLAVAAALLLAVGSLGWNIVLQRELASQQAELSRLRHDLPYVALVAASPRAVTRSLTPTEAAPNARGQIVVDESGAGVLFVSDMPRLQPGMAYQVWLIRDGERRSAGLFKVDDQGNGYLAWESPEPGSRFGAVGITLEPEQGSPGPTTPRVIGTDL